MACRWTITSMAFSGSLISEVRPREVKNSGRTWTIASYRFEAVVCRTSSAVINDGDGLGAGAATWRDVVALASGEVSAGSVR
jgi:hypothetical protein